MNTRSHPLMDQTEIRQTVIRQMRQRACPAVDNALHIVHHGKDKLIPLADLFQR